MDRRAKLKLIEENSKKPVKKAVKKDTPKVTPKTDSKLE
jgi:hypothetical protein